MINAIWFGLLVIAVLVAGVTDIVAPGSGRMQAVSAASMDSAKSAVELAIGLVGVMTLWLGIMRVAEAAGLMEIIARGIRPLMRRLFPDVPAEHPAIGAMTMNMAANLLGLGNAATPLGIKAMQELDGLNPKKGVATDAMCLFLAINTSGLAVLPLGVIALRQSAGSSEPASILFTTLFATACSTTAAIVVSRVLKRLPRFRADNPLLEGVQAGGRVSEQSEKGAGHD